MTLQKQRTMQKIALVDDDQNILTSVSMFLEAEDYQVLTYTDGQSALEHLFEERPDLVILDVKMPRMDGLATIQKIRETSNIPVIFLTSKDDEMDEVLGLRLGADDYIKKPFSQKLLLERIKAILRREAERQKNERNPSVQSVENQWVRGHLTMDLERYACQWKGENIFLTVTEFLLLKVLTEKPGIVKNRNQLIDHAYGTNIYVDDRTVDSHMKRLRKKFKDTDPDFDEIETVYGLGYKFKDTQ